MIPRGPSQRVFYVLSLLALGSTVVVGLIRAAQTNWSDLRYLWMAAAAIGAVVLGRPLWSAGPRIGSSVWTGLAATLAVAATGWVLGARHPVGVGLVSLSYGLACGAAVFFARLSTSGQSLSADER